MRWLNEQEQAERKNGRVADKLRAAIPLELSREQRAELVQEFGLGISRGRGSWVAAIHDRGEDEANPHVHFIFRDKDFETGKRVAGLSEKGSTERLRLEWEQAANRALERAGREERIDRRSLKDQGIEREAGIHIGPVALAMREKGREPVSQPQTVTMRDGQERVIDWPSIDQGRTRANRQREQEKRQELERLAKAQEQAQERPKVAKVQNYVQMPEGPQRANLGREQVSQELEAVTTRGRVDQDRSQEREAVTARERAAIEQSQPERRPALRLMERIMDAAAEWGRRVIERAREMMQRRSRKQPGPCEKETRGRPWRSVTLNSIPPGKKTRKASRCMSLGSWKWIVRYTRRSVTGRS